jgi:putative ABC transport system permease protein
MVVVPLETARRRPSNSQSMPPGAVQQCLGGRGRCQQPVQCAGRDRGCCASGTRSSRCEDDFAVRNISQIVATRTATTNLMSKLLGAVAGICLIIGGIGIMNIMLVW